MAGGVERGEHAHARGVAVLLQQLEDGQQRGAPGRGGGAVRQRTEPLELDVQVANLAEGVRNPAELVAEREQVARERVAEDGQRGAQPAGGDAHVVQRLDVVAKAGAGLVREVLGELAAHGRVGDLADARRAIDVRRAEVGGRLGREAGGGEPDAELGDRGARESGGASERRGERLDRLESRARGKLELEPAQRGGSAAAAAAVRVDRRLVERELGEDWAARIRVAGSGGRAQLEGAAVGAEREESAQLARTGDGADARGHGAGGGEQREAVGADQRLADLAADARAVALVDERLEGGLGGTVAAAHAQRVAGAVEGPVRGLEVLVEQPPVAGGSEREAKVVRERAHGALGGGVVVDLELPLELEVVAPLRRAWGVVLDQVLRV